MTKNTLESPPLGGEGQLTLPQQKMLVWVKDGARSADELIAASGKHAEVDRAIASHARAPAELLSTLSHSSDRATRARVAANPSTPTADIVRLGQQFPKEFLANPALDLLMLENPALLHEAPTALLTRFLRSDRCPPEFLSWAAGLNLEKLQLAVAMNAKAPAEALDALGRSPFEKVRQSLSQTSKASIGQEAAEAMFLEAVRQRLASLTADEAVDAWGRDIGLPHFASLSLPARLAVTHAD